jgi:hypothetical protein
MTEDAEAFVRGVIDGLLDVLILEVPAFALEKEVFDDFMAWFSEDCAAKEDAVGD